MIDKFYKKFLLVVLIVSVFGVIFYNFFPLPLKYKVPSLQKTTDKATSIVILKYRSLSPDEEVIKIEDESDVRRFINLFLESKVIRKKNQPFSPTRDFSYEISIFVDESRMILLGAVDEDKFFLSYNGKTYAFKYFLGGDLTEIDELF